MAVEYNELVERLRKLSSGNFIDGSASKVAMDQAANAIERLEHRVLVMSLDLKKGQ